jgi:hypothetical protein
MKNPLLVPELCVVIAAGDFKAHQEFHEATHPATAAKPFKRVFHETPCRVEGRAAP